jgi:mono/diheme cytochrome c family protein
MNKPKLIRPVSCAIVVLGLGALLSNNVYAADDDSAGSKVFHSQDCTGCHGPKGEGIPGLAPPLKGSQFVMTASEQDITHTIKLGRSGSDKHFKDISQPMPAHPTLTDQQLKDLVQYLKNGLQKGQ